MVKDLDELKKIIGQNVKKYRNLAKYTQKI